MKKTLMISAASVAMAAMPVVGVFATNPDPLTDTLNVTVSETCTFARPTGNGTYSATMAVNALNNSVGTSTFKAICNNPTGFSVSATPTSITGTGAAITYSASNPTAGSGTWTATNSTASANIAAKDGVLMTASGVTAADGQTATVVYKVGVRSNQAHGAYSGTIQYALTQNP